MIGAYQAAVALYFFPLYFILLFGPLFFAVEVSDIQYFRSFGYFPRFWLNPEGALSKALPVLWAVGFSLTALIFLGPLWAITRRHSLRSKKVTLARFLTGTVTLSKRGFFYSSAYFGALSLCIFVFCIFFYRNFFWPWSSKAGSIGLIPWIALGYSITQAGSMLHFCGPSDGRAPRQDYRE